MHIEHLSLTNFRNYARLEIGLPHTQPIVLHGDNAQGKTSLLESIYYLAAGKSPYTNSDRQLIHWRTEHDPLPYARIDAEIKTRDAALVRLHMTLLLEPGADGMRFRKVIRLNGAEKRLIDIVGMVNVVLFLPQDLALIEGGPAERRRFMDDTLGQVDGRYLEALDTYERILPQRNALLRRIADRQASPQELPYWDEQIIQAGSILIASRQHFLRELEISAQRTHLDLTGRRELLTLRYLPSFAPTANGDGQLSFDAPGLSLHRELSAEQVAPQFAERLRSELQTSIERGITLSGPHRDELRLLINDRDCGQYGSRGQARTAVLALKLAELDWMEMRLGDTPILLLDEVVAELDAQRRTYLLDRINGAAQTLVTTTELDVFPPRFLERSVIWQVREGQIDTSDRSSAH